MRHYKLILENLERPSYLGKPFPSTRDLKEKWREFDPSLADEKFPKKKKASDTDSSDDSSKKKGWYDKKKYRFKYGVNTVSDPVKKYVSDKKNKLNQAAGSVSSLLKSRSVGDAVSNAVDLAKNVVDVIY